MRNKISVKHALLAAMAVLVVSAGAVPTMAAVATVDTETTTTTTTSDWTEGTTLAGFNASAQNNSRVEVTFNATPGDATLSILDPTTSDNRSEMDVVYTNASGNTDANNHTVWNMSHDEFADVPIKAGQHKEFLVKLYDAGDDVNSPTYINITFNNTMERSVVYVDDTAADDDDITSLDTKHPWLADYLASFEGESATLSYEDTTTSANTTHYLNLQNDSVQTAFSDAAPEDVEDGAWLPTTYVKAKDNDDNTVYLPVFVNEKSDWSFLDDDEAYAVYDTDSDQMEVHFAGDDRFDDVEKTDLTVTGNKRMGMFNAADMFKSLDASSTETYSNAWHAASIPMLS